ncbi:MAG: 3-dehydroquinate synthase family protein [Acidimicrobiales bacterium]
MIIVPVALRSNPYDVIVGDGARRHLAGLIPERASRAAVVTQGSIGISVDPGIEYRVFTIGEGEEAKELATIESLCRSFAAWGLTRSDVVIGVGGGVVTDTTGFAAAVYHRGVDVVHVATTLLGQVDAAIGGKTGVNLPEGKNLVGAFWQPSAVLCDTELLKTLPEREYRSGLGEMAKYRFLTHDDRDITDANIENRVAACVRIKAKVVAADEREGAAGLRATLNYGHTLAHALETSGGYDLRHGEAVAIGLVFAAELAAQLGRIDEARVAQHREIVQGYDLPSAIPPGANNDLLIELFSRDKKADSSEGFTFVLDGPNGVELVYGVGRPAIDAALEACR